MELMDAGCLTEILGPDIDFPETHIAYVCKNVLTALSYLHHNNKLHRDIKSDNVLMNTKGGDQARRLRASPWGSRRRRTAASPWWARPSGWRPELILRLRPTMAAWTSGRWASPR